MHCKHAFIFTYIFNIYLIINNTAVCLSYGHRKRELNFNNYPANRAIVDPREYNNYYQHNTLNDPGYTTQNENNNDDKTVLGERTSNTSGSQNFMELRNPSVPMFHLMYMQPQPYKRQQTQENPDVPIAYPNQLNSHSQQLNINSQNLAYAGPHLFPTPLPPSNNYQNMQQSNHPMKHFNTVLHNIYPAQFFLHPYQQDTKVPSKMEAPFIPSQFLGYGQQQKQELSQQLPQQPQQLSQQQPQQLSQPQNQQLSQQQIQQFPQQTHQTARPLQTALKPVHEEHQVSPYHAPNLIYMAPNNVYDLYRKSK